MGRDRIRSARSGLGAQQPAEHHAARQAVQFHDIELPPTETVNAVRARAESAVAPGSAMDAARMYTTFAAS
jgi:hypothetical protein